MGLDLGRLLGGVADDDVVAVEQDDRRRDPLALLVRDDHRLAVLVHVGDRRVGRPQVDPVHPLETFRHVRGSRCWRQRSGPASLGVTMPSPSRHTRRRIAGFFVGFERFLLGFLSLRGSRRSLQPPRCPGWTARNRITALAERRGPLIGSSAAHPIKATDLKTGEAEVSWTGNPKVAHHAMAIGHPDGTIPDQTPRQDRFPADRTRLLPFPSRTGDRCSSPRCKFTTKTES